MKKSESLDFVRKFYRIPTKYQLSWALVSVCIGGSYPEHHPGVLIGDTGLFIDLSKTNIMSAVELGCYNVSVQPAVRYKLNGRWHFTGTTDGQNVQVRENYIVAKHERKIFDEKMIGKKLC